MLAYARYVWTMQQLRAITSSKFDTKLRHKQQLFGRFLHCQGCCVHSLWPRCAPCAWLQQPATALAVQHPMPVETVCDQRTGRSLKMSCSCCYCCCGLKCAGSHFMHCGTADTDQKRMNVVLVGCMQTSNGLTSKTDNGPHDCPSKHPSRLMRTLFGIVA